jgi:hypothetical protein
MTKPSSTLDRRAKLEKQIPSLVCVSTNKHYFCSGGVGNFGFIEQPQLPPQLEELFFIKNIRYTKIAIVIPTMLNAATD